MKENAVPICSFRGSKSLSTQGISRFLFLIFKLGTIPKRIPCGSRFHSITSSSSIIYHSSQVSYFEGRRLGTKLLHHEKLPFLLLHMWFTFQGILSIANFYPQYIPLNQPMHKNAAPSWKETSDGRLQWVDKEMLSRWSSSLRENGNCNRTVLWSIEESSRESNSLHFVLHVPARFYCNIAPDMLHRHM